MDTSGKVEVWYQENYDVLKGDYGDYFHKSFDDENEAVQYIQSCLEAELQKFKETDKNLSDEELLHRYKMFGTDYFLKNAKKGFSSWKYMEERLQRKNEY